jgi:hypothetical protein
MKFKMLTMTTSALLLTANIGWTADDTEGDSAESTIRLMGVSEAMLPDAVTKEITLPAALMEDSVAVEKAAEGLATATENRQQRESGLVQADEARERGSEMAAEAKDNRENRGRSEDRPEPPPNPGPPSN